MNRSMVNSVSNTMSRVHEPRIGIIGGSGLYHIEGFTKQKWVNVATPFGNPSDRFLTGELSGRPVVFLPRHGRGHRILPGELNHRANLWAMKKLGVAWIMSVSAVGSLQARYQPCDIASPSPTRSARNCGNGCCKPAGRWARARTTAAPT